MGRNIIQCHKAEPDEFIQKSVRKSTVRKTPGQIEAQTSVAQSTTEMSVGKKGVDITALESGFNSRRGTSEMRKGIASHTDTEIEVASGATHVYQSPPAVAGVIRQFDDTDEVAIRQFDDTDEVGVVPGKVQASDLIEDF